MSAWVGVVLTAMCVCMSEGQDEYVWGWGGEWVKRVGVVLKAMCVSMSVGQGAWVCRMGVVLTTMCVCMVQANAEWLQVGAGERGGGGCKSASAKVCACVSVYAHVSARVCACKNVGGVCALCL